MNKRRIKIRENSWLAKIAAGRLKYGQVALVVGHTIHLHNTSIAYFLARPSWVLHELKHVAQYEQLGIIGFLWRYLLQYFRYGYYKAPLEAEARAAENETSLLHQYDLSDYGFPS